MPQSKKLELQRERTRRLEEAQKLFTQVVAEFELRDESTLSPVEALSFRNAYFYRADCAYDLRQFKQAIDLYEVAAKRWEAHPASLVALVQIVNSYCEMNMVQEAKVANLRARANAAGGGLEIDSRPGSGTRIIVHLSNSEARRT